MEQNPDIFEMQFKGETLRIQRVDMPGARTVYRILFANRTPPLVITRATNFDADRFWTSIPEGRQREAEQIGPLIAEYVKSHQ